MISYLLWQSGELLTKEIPGVDTQDVSSCRLDDAVDADATITEASNQLSNTPARRGWVKGRTGRMGKWGGTQQRMMVLHPFPESHSAKLSLPHDILFGYEGEEKDMGLSPSRLHASPFRLTLLLFPLIPGIKGRGRNDRERGRPVRGVALKKKRKIISGA